MRICNTCQLPKEDTKYRGNLKSCKVCNNRKNTVQKQLSGYEQKKTTHNINNITRKYVAKILNISMKDLTEDLYNTHKASLLFKRKVQKDNNINIQKLNYYGK